MPKCRCPKGYPKVKLVEFVSVGNRAGFRFDALLQLHTGRCALTDEQLHVQKGA